MNRLLAVCALLFAAAGCASTPTVRPAPDANVHEGGPGVTGSAAGVRLVATLDEWR